MRTKKLIKNLAIVFLIICIIILAIDIFKVLKINLDFLGMNSTERVPSSSKIDSVRYEPTEYIISNKDEALDEIKEMVVEFKETKPFNTQGLIEIANINKIEALFYDYQKYMIVKYKLLNIIEDLPKLHKATTNYTDEQLGDYFSQNKEDVENYYGITSKDEFIKLAKSLKFLTNTKIKVAILQDDIIGFDMDDDKVEFYINILAENEKESNYFVNVDYYGTTDNQIAPYVSFKSNN